jgi:tetratricopeptide (TPR) repeat protein
VIAALVFAVLLAGAPAPVRDVAADEARTLYVEAKTAYDAGRFDDALVGFQAAFAKKPLPGFLFNLGQCERQLGHHDRAIFFFERYLDEKPDAANRALVEELIAESRARLPAPAPAMTVPAAAPVAVTPQAPTTTTTTTTTDEPPEGPWLLVAGAGVVTLAVAIGVGIAVVLTSPTLGTHTVGE